MNLHESSKRRGVSWRCRASVTLLFLAGCPGSSATPDSGKNSTDAGRDGGMSIPCGLTDGTNCTRDAGGFGVCCDGTCVDTGSDPLNCDQCGNACPRSAICRASTCVLGAAQATCFDGGCPAGLACAGGYYCGTLACAAGEVGGLCALSVTANQAGMCCSGACVSVSSDDMNCGACGRSCVDGGFCFNRSCEPNPSCANSRAGLRCRLTESSLGGCCGSSCLDLDSDPQNCGACGEECPVDGTCLDGGCVSPDGGPESCVTGDGGALCPSGTLCVGGGCLAPTCAEGGSGARCGFDATAEPSVGLCCDGGCVDPMSDSHNCGGCGIDCHSGVCDGGCLPGASDAGVDAGMDAGADAGPS